MIFAEAFSSLADSAGRKLESDLSQIRRCAGLLTRVQLWGRENEHCNSVGNLILHLAGNLRQWIVSGIGGEPFERDRPGEFAARDAGDAGAILAPLESTVRRAAEIIRGMSGEQFAQRRRIQGYDVTGLEAVFHVAEHFSFHTGQIVHMTKALCDVDLSLYDAQGRRVGAASAAPW